MVDVEAFEGLFRASSKGTGREGEVLTTIVRSSNVVPHGREAPVVPRYLRCLAAKEPYGGEYFSYLMTTGIKNRKKDTFIGVARNPWHQLYLHNSGNAKCRSTLCGAPGWYLVAMLGPFFLSQAAEECARVWTISGRGVDSKLRKARAIAVSFDVKLFSEDVASCETPNSFLSRHAPRSAKRSYVNLCRRVVRRRINKR